MVQIDFHLFVEIFRTNYQDVIIARGRSYPGVKCYGGGHHKAVVIVDMFADQVHASGRSGNHGSSPKRAVEPVLYELETIIHRSSPFDGSRIIALWHFQNFCKIL